MVLKFDVFRMNCLKEWVKYFGLVSFEPFLVGVDDYMGYDSQLILIILIKKALWYGQEKLLLILFRRCFGRA